MFSKTKKSNMSNGGSGHGSHNTIAAGTKIVGEIESNSDIRIDGNLKGNLTTKARLIVGETGVIIGDITCKNSVVEGKTEGKIIVSELLTLRATSNVNGDIVTNKLSVEPGAVFSGSCNMNGSASASTNGKKTTKQLG